MWKQSPWKGLVIGASITFLTSPAGGQQAPEEEKEPFLRLPEVVISATRLPGSPVDLSQVPTQVRVIDREEMSERGAQSVPDAVQFEPGVTLYDEVGNAFERKLDLRGFNSIPVPTTAVFLDGVRLNEPDFGAVNFELIPFEALERIEVAPGTATIFGKNALGGVLNLTTRRGGPVPETRVETAYGSYGHQRYVGATGGTLKGIDYFISLARELEEGFRRESDGRVTRLFTKLGYRVGEGTDLTLSFMHGNGRFKQAGSLPESDIVKGDRRKNLTPGDFFDKLVNTVTLNGTQKLPWGFTLALNGFVQDGSKDSFIVGLTSTSRTTTEILGRGGTVQLNHEATIAERRSLLTAGAEFVRHDFTSDSFSKFGSFTSTGGSDTNEETLGFYLQEAFELMPFLTLTAGFRYDRDSISFVDEDTPANSGTRRFSRLNPKVGLTYSPVPPLTLYASYSEGFRTPTVDELFAFAPFSSNPDLKPVKSETYEVGARARYRDWLEGTVALFLTDARDDIFFVVTDPSTGGGINENAQRTRRRGLEVTVKARMSSLVDGFLTYSFVQATFEREVVLSSGTVEAGDELPLVPRHQLGTGVNVHPLQGLTLSLSGLYVSGKFLNGDEPNNSSRLPGYFVANAKAAYRWKNLTAFAQVNNLFDRDYETWGTLVGSSRFLIPAPGINAFFGLALEFSGYY
ncbi:MAG: TonB-dependent receptor [Candidatus Methylomirabilales bacterium]